MIPVSAGWLVIVVLYVRATRSRRRDLCAALASCLVMFGIAIWVRSQRADARQRVEQRRSCEWIALDLEWIANDLVNPVYESRREEVVLEYRGFKKALSRTVERCLPARSSCMDDLLSLGRGYDNGSSAALLSKAFASGHDCDPATVAAAKR